MTSPVTWRENGVVGKYTLLAKLAKGGMGEIYLAQLRGVAGFEKLVVIKRLLPHLAENEHFVGMLLDEARIVARLSHPNVCQVHELNVEGGEYFIVMEYLEGVSLLELLRRHAQTRTPTDVRLAAAIVAQACEGLHAAHELRDASGSPTNLVHRDISPSNLFVTASGTLKVLDFGIAKTPDKLVTTRTGAVKGKWAYMSPEQVLRQPLDRRSDIFSLGIVLFEALSGRRLFRRRSEYETCHAITERDAPPLRKYRPDIADAIGAVVMRALSRPRQRRHATARELGRALTEACAAHGGLMTNAEISDYLQAWFQTELDDRRAFIKGVTSAPPEATMGALRALPTVPHAAEVASDEGDPGVDDAFDVLGGVEFGEPAPAAGRHDTAQDDTRHEDMTAATVTSHVPERPVTLEPADGADLAWATTVHAAGEPAPPHAVAGGDMPQSGDGAPDVPPAGEPVALASPPRWMDSAIVPRPTLDTAGGRGGLDDGPVDRARGGARVADGPRARGAGSRWGVIALAMAAAGGVAAGVYFYFQRPARSAPAPRVVVYEGGVMQDGDAALPADAGADGGDADGRAGAAAGTGGGPVASAGRSSDTGAAGAAGARPPVKPPRSRRAQKRDGTYYTRIVGRRQRRLLGCLDEHRAQIENTPRISLDLRIETSGRVSSVTVQPAALARTAVARCLSDVVRTLDFGRHKEPVDVSVPLRVKRSPT